MRTGDLKSILLIFCLALATLQQFMPGRSECFEGVKVLTRTKGRDGGYSLGQKCICPIDYMGSECKNHRQIFCYLTSRGMNPSSINALNFKSTMEVSLEVNAECYIEQEPGKLITLRRFIIERQLSTSKFAYSLENIRKGEEVIWANRSQLFDDDGFLKYIEGQNYTVDGQGRKVMPEEVQRQILQGQGPVEFKYLTNFLGIPLSNSSFYSIPQIIRPTQNRITYNKLPLHFENALEYSDWINKTALEDELEDLTSEFSLEDLLNDPSKAKEIGDKMKDYVPKQTQYSKMGVLPYFTTKVTVNVSEATEFHVIRIQIGILQLYQYSLYLVETGVNSVEFFLPVQVEGIGDAPVYSVNFNRKQVPRFVYLIGMILLSGLVFLLYRWREWRAREKDNRIRQNVEEMQGDASWR